MTTSRSLRSFPFARLLRLRTIPACKGLFAHRAISRRTAAPVVSWRSFVNQAEQAGRFAPNSPWTKFTLFRPLPDTKANKIVRWSVRILFGLMALKLGFDAANMVQTMIAYFEPRDKRLSKTWNAFSTQIAQAEFREPLTKAIGGPFTIDTTKPSLGTGANSALLLTVFQTRTQRKAKQFSDTEGNPVTISPYIIQYWHLLTFTARQNLDLPIVGPQGPAVLHVELETESGDWLVTKITVSSERSPEGIQVETPLGPFDAGWSLTLHKHV